MNGPNHAVVHFDSIALQDQRIRGAVDDYLMSVVHFVVQHPEGRRCPGCAATVRHRFRDTVNDTVDVMVTPPDECKQYVPLLKPRIEQYYREHVGVEGTAIRVGSRGASPWLVGTQRVVRATVPLPISDTR